MARKRKKKQHNPFERPVLPRLNPRQQVALANTMCNESALRVNEMNAPFDPVAGIGAPPFERFAFHIDEVKWFLPMSMKDIKMISTLMTYGSIARFCEAYNCRGKEEYIKWKLIQERCRHDFAFWAITCATIKNKDGGPDIHFRLNRPQVKVLAMLEKMRLENKPIRMIILKARQWGGSTLVQIYMAWIQLVLKENWNSAIVAHLNSASLNIRAMYMRLIAAYPPQMLDLKKPTPLALSPFNTSRVDYTITQGRKQVRKSVISVGSMQSPDTVRSFDIALVHFSEVGLWKKTEGKSPEDTIQAVTASVLDEPLTLIVMESTAKGENNLFHKEWLDAKQGLSDKMPAFISWFEIPKYQKPFDSPADMFNFALWIVKNRRNERQPSSREEPGAYLWKLWDMGASLEAINWYVAKRKSYRSHDMMASEYPSDDIEAFAHSGRPIFDKYKVELLRASCRSPKFLGEIHGNDVVGLAALDNLRFIPDTQGLLRIWDMPDRSFKHRNRYVVAVDVGGRSDKADYSVILVLDRWFRTQGEGDVVVAEWHGHIRHDFLAWKMVQIAAFYCDALLVVESNTFETRDNDTEGEHTPFILDQIGNAYRNMYTREASPENIRLGRARKWGFQTNVHTKAMIIDNLIAVISDGLYTEREEAVLQEYNVYERDDRGGMNAAEGYHDDRLMARAIGLYVSQNMPMPSVPNPDMFRVNNTNPRPRNESFF